MKELEETHQKGLITIENIPDELGILKLAMDEREPYKFMNGDFGIQIAKDGRVWICINGIAFIRFKPEGDKYERTTHSQE